MTKFWRFCYFSITWWFFFWCRDCITLFISALVIGTIFILGKFPGNQSSRIVISLFSICWMFNFSVVVIKKLIKSLAKLFGSLINFSCDKRPALTTLLNPHGNEEGKAQDCVCHYNLHMDCGDKKLATADRKWVNRYSLLNATVLIYPVVYKWNVGWTTDHLNSGVTCLRIY